LKELIFLSLFLRKNYVSHQRERKEKNCLNCDTIVVGRYCHNCGQENVETRQSFWSLARHFIYDILHFDGGFFHTMKNLLFRPGFVARQYAEGKRMTYLHPIRMYLFTSALFFLVFFSFESLHFTTQTHLTARDRMDLAAEMEREMEPGDSLTLRRIALIRDTSRPVNIDTMKLSAANYITLGGNKKYHTLAEYDSVQRSLPASERDGWFQRKLDRKTLEVSEKYPGKGESTQALLKIFQHNLPYLLFISLPFFALILKLLYIRRKNFYYSDHATFTLYHYVFSFILLLVLFAFNALEEQTHWRLFSWITVLVMIYWPVYLLLEMKTFYRQGWGKTLGKFLLLDLLGAVVIILLFVAFLFFSIFQM